MVCLKHKNMINYENYLHKERMVQMVALKFTYKEFPTYLDPLNTVVSCVWLTCMMCGQYSCKLTTIYTRYNADTAWSS